jgi:phenylacetate-CoA ligase
LIARSRTLHESSIGPLTAQNGLSGGVQGPIEHRLLATFGRAATEAPFYKILLDEHGVNPAEVRSLSAFSELCPILSKANTFERFPIESLGPGGSVSDIAEVMTSSGRGGRFSFGLTTRAEAAATASFLDAALDEAFHINSRTTLAINCLPMGVVFSSNVMTVATTSVREDMAVALIQTFGSAFDQLLLVGDPLFLKRLADHATAVGLDWTRYRVNAVIGDEIFGEWYRAYLAAHLGTDAERPERGYIMSSFGVGELGLHLGYETRTTIALRRAAIDHPAFARELFGVRPDQGLSVPMLFAFDPLRIFIEILDPDTAGYGMMTTSMLDSERRIPLLRYQAGDVAALLSADRIPELAAQHGIELPGPVPAAMFALRGRDSEALPNGGHVGLYKDALYRHHHLADALTGAMRLTFDAAQCTMHVQLAPDAVPAPDLERGLLESVPHPFRPARVVVWPYRQFPFGMTLDYQRKFVYYSAGTPQIDPPDPRSN